MQGSIGIDYGSKMAGTTAIAYLDQKNCLKITQSLKKRDADQFILDFVQQQHVQNIFLDAPLSLPGIYRNLSGFDDYFYRKSDRALKAMSPMFIGGLTARAIKLKDQLTSLNIQTTEVYPGYLAKTLNFTELFYKKKEGNIQQILEQLRALYPLASQFPILENWHQLDAVLALTSGYRYFHKKHLTFGDPTEGQIVI